MYFLVFVCLYVLLDVNVCAQEQRLTPDVSTNQALNLTVVRGEPIRLECRVKNRGELHEMVI